MKQFESTKQCTVAGISAYGRRNGIPNRSFKNRSTPKRILSTRLKKARELARKRGSNRQNKIKSEMTEITNGKRTLLTKFDRGNGNSTTALGDTSPQHQFGFSRQHTARQNSKRRRISFRRLNISRSGSPLKTRKNHVNNVMFQAGNRKRVLQNATDNKSEESKLHRTKPLRTGRLRNTTDDAHKSIPNGNRSSNANNRKQPINNKLSRTTIRIAVQRPTKRPRPLKAQHIQSRRHRVKSGNRSEKISDGSEGSISVDADLIHLHFSIPHQNIPATDSSTTNKTNPVAQKSGIPTKPALHWRKHKEHSVLINPKFQRKHITTAAENSRKKVAHSGPQLLNIKGKTSSSKGQLESRTHPMSNSRIKQINRHQAKSRLLTKPFRWPTRASTNSQIENHEVDRLKKISPKQQMRQTPTGKTSSRVRTEPKQTGPMFHGSHLLQQKLNNRTPEKPHSNIRTDSFKQDATSMHPIGGNATDQSQNAQGVLPTDTESAKSDADDLVKERVMSTNSIANDEGRTVSIAGAEIDALQNRVIPLQRTTHAENQTITMVTKTIQQSRPQSTFQHLSENAHRTHNRPSPAIPASVPSQQIPAAAAHYPGQQNTSSSTAVVLVPPGRLTTNKTSVDTRRLFVEENAHNRARTFILPPLSQEAESSGKSATESVHSTENEDESMAENASYERLASAIKHSGHPPSTWTNSQISVRERNEKYDITQKSRKAEGKESVLERYGHNDFSTVHLQNGIEVQINENLEESEMRSVPVPTPWSTGSITERHRSKNTETKSDGFNEENERDFIRTFNVTAEQNIGHDGLQAGGVRIDQGTEREGIQREEFLRDGQAIADRRGIRETGKALHSGLARAKR